MYKRWKQHDVKGRGWECWRTKHITDKYWTMYLLCGFYWTAVEIEGRGEGERERERREGTGWNWTRAAAARTQPQHMGHTLYQVNYQGTLDTIFLTMKVIVPLTKSSSFKQKVASQTLMYWPPSCMWWGLFKKRSDLHQARNLLQVFGMAWSKEGKGRGGEQKEGENNQN